MTIKFIKLTTGDELVADVEDHGDKITMTNAALFSVQFDFGEKPAAPKTRVDIFAPHAKGLKMTVSKNHVLCIEEPQDGLLQYYTETFLPGLGKETK